MNQVTKLALEYFRPPGAYFWRWADVGAVAEWQTGTTICYKDDLFPILRILAPDGLPPLGTILLLLAACQDNWKDAEKEIEILAKLADSIKEKDSIELEDFLTFGTQFLELVNKLPKNLRTGAARIRLIQEVAGVIPHKIPATLALEFINEMDSGKLVQLTIPEVEGSAAKLFTADLENLQQAFGLFDDSKSLELAIRTGLQKIPGPAEVELPEGEDTDLLHQLENDRKTKGVSRLARQLMAAINFPMFNIGSGDLPLGGVSDITNRGNLDRLLLSELAHDDLSLMVRLVNNEALYLRREEPPSKLNRQRTLLVDTSIKMWGMPRVFAVSAAIACSQNNRYEAPVLAFAFGGQDYEVVEFNTKAGVIEALELLDGSLHCGEALQRFFADQSSESNREYILITDAALIKDAAFLAHFWEIKHLLAYLITVDRAGDLHFFQMASGQKKVLSQSKFNLEELLFPASPKNRLETLEVLPKFLDQYPAPLLFPSARILINKDTCSWLTGIGVMAVSELQHLLFWPQSRAGAIEVLDYIEPGQYYFEICSPELVFLLVVSSKNTVILYEFDVERLDIIELYRKDFSDNKIFQVAFTDYCYHFHTYRGTFDLNCNQEVVQLEKKATANMYLFRQKKPGFPRNDIKKFINNGYSVLQHVNRIYINEDGLLCLDSRAFQFVNHNSSLSLSPVKKTKATGPAAYFDQTRLTLTHNKYLRFRRAVWENGSEALIDPRGFLHLRSADPSIPEITMVLVLDRTTACWSSDGKICGALYFTAKSTESGELAKPFYQNYIQKFIDALN